jgi:AcrR family transcriptional regulator
MASTGSRSHEVRSHEAREPAAPVADGRRLRWAEHRAQRRAKFVEAGVAAVDEHGPDASAEQIAAVARVSRTVLYRYFRDRDDLRGAIADEIVQAVLASVLPKLDLTPASTPREVISAAVGEIVGWLDEHPNLYFFLRSRRTGLTSSLEQVENTLADSIAGILKMLMLLFGIEGEEAEPGAYGIVGFVESAGAWWLQHRSMSRERFTEVVSAGVWNLLEGTARTYGVQIGYDDPLPLGAPTVEGAAR